MSLESAVGSKKSVEFTVALVFVDVLSPFPKEIEQSEKQAVLFFGNAYVFSAYPTKSSRSVFKLASSMVESYTREEPTSLSSSTLTYGPYKSVAPFSHAEAKVHFENNAPFVTVTSLLREYEVSHWGGNLAVTDKYVVTHTGAKLKGSFSRYDYQRNPSAHGASSVRSLTAILPPSATDVYYRDIIGNISTSALRHATEQVEVELRPRFPLFGGWKTEFTLGYNTPLSSALSTLASSGKYLLTLDMAGAFADAPVADATIVMVLPEGSYDVALHTPFAEEPALSLSARKTYLDTAGRVVASFDVSNLVNDQDLTFQVSYSLSSSALLMEPALLIMAALAFFAAAMAYVRLDFSLTPSAALKASDEIVAFSAQVSRATSALAKLDNALSAFASSSDTKSFQASTKSLDAEFSTAVRSASAVANQVSSSVASDLRSVVADLNARHKLFTELASAQSDFFSGAVDDDSLAATKARISEKYFHLATVVENTLNSLS